MSVATASQGAVQDGITDPTKWADNALGVKVGSFTSGGAASNLGLNASGAGAKPLTPQPGAAAQTNWGAVASVAGTLGAAAIGGGVTTAVLIVGSALGAAATAAANNAAVAALGPEDAATAATAQAAAVAVLNNQAAQNAAVAKLGPNAMPQTSTPPTFKIGPLPNGIDAAQNGAGALAPGTVAAAAASTASVTQAGLWSRFVTWLKGIL